MAVPVYVLYAVFVAVLCSCTGVPYGYIDYGDGESTLGKTVVLFSFDWGGLPDDMIPEQCTIAMSRIVNEVHYTYTVECNSAPDGIGSDDSSAGDFAAGDSETVDSGTEASETGNSEAGEQEKPRISASVLDGDYYAIAFSGTEGYSITGLEVFKRNHSVGMKTLYAELPNLTADEIGQKLGERPIDFNPSFATVPDAGSLYISAKKLTLDSGHDVAEILFEPEDVTAELTFRVRINVENGVRINGLFAELSGVPVKVQLMSGKISGEELGKVYFRMEQIAADAAGFVFDGKVRVLGLFSSQDLSLVSGPGILRLSVHAVSGENERKFYAGINLKRLIDNAALMERTEDGSGYRTVAGSALIEVDNVLTVRNGHVESGGDDALEGWFDTNKDIEVEV